MTTTSPPTAATGCSLAQQVQLLLEQISNAVGPPFFEALVTGLAGLFQVRYAVIGRLAPDGQSVQTLAVHANGRLADNFTYQLGGTPCAQVIGKGPRYFPERVAELFPEDLLLAELGVSCYLGVPLFNSSSQPLGNLLLLHDAPIPADLVDNALAMMAIFGQRASGEIERLDHEQKLREQDRLLRESHQRYQAFTELSADYFHSCSRRVDQPFRVEWIGGQFEAITGYTIDELFAAGCWLPLTHPDDRDQMFSGLMQLTPGQEHHAEFRLVRKDGSLRWIREASRCLQDTDDQALLRLYGTCRDVTQRKQHEAALQQTCQAAEEASRSKSAFLSTVSHEIRSPLNGIMGMAQLLRTTEITDEQTQYLRMLEDSAHTLLALLNDILDVSRVEAGRLPIEQVPFRLDELLQQTIEQYRPVAHAQGLAVELEQDPSLPDLVLGDPLRIKQILLNLVGNAVKFTRQGSILISSSQARAADGAPRLRLTVSDTGIGIQPEALTRIFEQFTQADRSTSRLYGGSGLGLAICRQLAELMEGTVTVESIPGQGSSFQVDLPLRVAAADAVPVSRGPFVEQASLAPLRILLAEDQEVGRIFVTTVLRRRGHEVTAVADGQQAVQLLAEQPFDLILLDLQLPDMAGEEVLRRLPQVGAGRRVPVVALTAHALAGDRERLLQSGFDGYCPKPLEITQLEAEIARVLAPCTKDLTV